MQNKIFLLGSMNVILNNYFYQFLVFIFFLKGDFSLISEITFLLAPLIFLKESFSSNKRTLLLSDKKNSLFKVYFRERVLYATFILIIYLLSIKFFNLDKNKFFFILIVILTILMWINELIITSYEINNNKKKIVANLILLIILYVFFVCYIYFPIKNLLYIFSLILIFLTLTRIYNSKMDLFFVYKKINLRKKNNYKFLSTISINLANLIWRIFFFIFLEKQYSGILFSVFAIMSFPSTLYSNTIGMKLETLNKKNIFKIFLIAYYSIAILVMYYIFVYKIIPLNDPTFSNFSITTGLFSLLGSLIMIFAISKRIKIINYKKINRNFLFRTDIMYSTANILCLVIVYIFLGSYFFSILFFISSICSLIYYINHKRLN